MFCQKCGFQMNDGTAFCPRCGADCRNAAPEATPTPGYGTAPTPGYGSASTPGYGSAPTPGYGSAPTPGYGYGAVPTAPIEKRNIATAIILSIVTCGIYGIIWFIKLTDETNAALGEEGTSGGMAFLYTLLTCGIYSIYWSYKQGEKLDNLATRRGQAPSSRGVLYLVLSFFGLGMVAYALMQDSLNKLA